MLMLKLTAVDLDQKQYESSPLVGGGEHNKVKSMSISIRPPN